MPTTTNAITTLYALEQSAYNLLKTNRDTNARHKSAELYMRAFCVITECHLEALPDTVPSYSATLSRFLDLVDSPLQPDSVRFSAMNAARTTLGLLDATVTFPPEEAVAEYQSLLNRLNAPLGPDLKSPFKEAADIKRSVIEHINFAHLMDRFVTIAESTTQSSDTRREAILAFNEIATSAMTTFDQPVCRTDYDQRFIKLASATRDPLIEKAAINYGFSGQAPRISLGSSPAGTDSLNKGFLSNHDLR